MAYADYDYEFGQDEEGEDYLDYYDEVSKFSAILTLPF